MDSNVIGLVAVIMSLGIPMACLYTFYRVKKLRTDERMAALARGVNVPMEPELPHAARSRRSGILLTAGAVGYIATFAMIARMEPDAWIAGSFGIIPLCVGIGYFVDFALLRKDQIA
jgi:Domain of unknown function (DUF6249)